MLSLARFVLILAVVAWPAIGQAQASADTDVPAYEHALLEVPVLSLRSVVNHDVVGGGLALFLVNYGASLTFGLLTGVASCSSVEGVNLWLVPLSSVAGGVCGWIPGTVGVVIGLGQIVCIFLMAAGGSIFRRWVASSEPAWSGQTLAIRF